MILLIYLLGVAISVLLEYNEIKMRYSVITLNNILIFIILGLLSWFTVVEMMVIWLINNGDEIVIWKKK